MTAMNAPHPLAGDQHAGAAFHRQSLGRAGDRRDAADDRPVRRRAVRGDRARQRGRHRSRRCARRRRARDGAWGALAPAEKGRLLARAVARDPRSRRRARADRGARLRQAAEAGARRRRRLRALLRVLRRRLRQAARRDDSLSRGLHGADVARAARRHRPHHSRGTIRCRSSGARSAARSRPATPAWSSRPRTRACRCCASPSSPRASGCPRARSTSSPGSGARPAPRWPRIRASSTCRSPGRPRPARGSRGEAAKRHCPVTLELGGKSPQIVFADADLDAALPALVNAIVQNAGQTCSAGSRLLVERSRYEEVLARLGERFAALQVGSGARRSRLRSADPRLAAASACAASSPTRERDGIATVAQGHDRRRRAGRRLLRRAARCCATCRRTSPRLRGGVRPGARRDAVRRRGRCGAPRQRHGLRPGRRRLDARRRTAAAHGARGPQRPGVRQQLRRRRRRRIAVRRRQALGLRPRKGLRGAVWLHDAQDRGLQHG